MSEAKGRSQVLDEVRRALGRSQTVKPPPLDHLVDAREPETSADLLGRFTEEIKAVGAHLYAAHTREDAGARVAQILAAAGGGEVALTGAAVLAELDMARQLASRHIATFDTGEYRPEEKERWLARLALATAGVTAVEYAIAETGTLVITGDQEQALVISLLPPVHIAILRRRQIIATLGEAVSRLGQEHMRGLAPTRSTTFITGPSRTSDVELTLSIGVHGPKQLHVILLGD